MRKTRFTPSGCNVRDFTAIEYAVITDNIYKNYEICEMMDKLDDPMFEDKIYRFVQSCIMDYLKEVVS